MGETHSVKDTGGAAFPRTGYWTINGPTETDTTRQEGMDLRDYFAAKAMAAWITMGGLGVIIDKHRASPEQALTILAGKCYEMSDAMIAERAK